VHGRLSVTTQRDSPAAARGLADYTGQVWLTTGEQVTAIASVRCTQDTVVAHGRVSIDGFVIADRRWQAPLRRE
jgi:hypothetical protein